MLNEYLNNIYAIYKRGDAREESYYAELANFMKSVAANLQLKAFDITILPKKTEAGNPDFRVWDGKLHYFGYIEAKAPGTNLDVIEQSEQLKRYRSTFPNLILTDFLEFRLYRDGVLIKKVVIGDYFSWQTLKFKSVVQKEDEWKELIQVYFNFSLPKITSAKQLAIELAKRTRFLRDEVIAIEIEEENKQGRHVLLEFYDSFKKQLINNLTHEQFADLYAQTLTYGIFAARTKATGEFNRELIYKYIPNTLGILKSIFKFISYEEPPKSLEVLIDDIAEVLYVTDIQKILHTFFVDGKGNDPIIHFYETFLSEYDPKLREKRGVYYTPEPVVRYIVRSVHSLLKSHFNLKDGLADNSVTLLDPAAGTLTFPAEAIKLAIQEHTEKYGTGGINQFIKNHILPHFYALELMMAPYTVGHLKMSFLLHEFDYQMADDERFKLYLTNTLEHDLPPQIEIPFAHEITEEGKLANQVKQNEPVLVIMGNPPYSGASENKNDWTEQLLKTDLDGAQSYFTVDGQPLGEKNPKWLQNDYVKFIRFAQWKIQKAGKGIVGMITDHSYLDNSTFKGMRQSLMKTFDEIYILDLHGNSLKKEKAPDGSKDENVFDIKQGVSIILMIKSGSKITSFFHKNLYGPRIIKYDWLEKHNIDNVDYSQLTPSKPYYLFRSLSAPNDAYDRWLKITDIFQINSVGVVTARDEVAINYTKHNLMNSINQFSKINVEVAKTLYKISSNSGVLSFAKAQKAILKNNISSDHIKPILYRPFDIRYIYYPKNSVGFIERPRYEVMQHLVEENVALICNKSVKIDFSHVLISKHMTDLHILETANASAYIFPLYIYPDIHSDDMFTSKEKQPNIKPEILMTLNTRGLTPENLMYYVYGVLFSNIYRERYAEYLALDFPHIPITSDNELFLQIAGLGKAIADLHLMKSSELDVPIAKYQGNGNNDAIEKVEYDEATGRVRINNDKYFEGITPEVWNYHIGGYQVLAKYLKDRKGLRMEDPVHYCRIVTALSKTIEYQQKIDEIYEKIEERLTPTGGKTHPVRCGL